MDICDLYLVNFPICCSIPTFDPQLALDLAVGGDLGGGDEQEEQLGAGAQGEYQQQVRLGLDSDPDWQALGSGGIALTRWKGRRTTRMATATTTTSTRRALPRGEGIGGLVIVKKRFFLHFHI